MGDKPEGSGVDGGQQQEGTFASEKAAGDTRPKQVYPLQSSSVRRSLTENGDTNQGTTSAAEPQQPGTRARPSLRDRPGQQRRCVCVCLCLTLMLPMTPHCCGRHDAALPLHSSTQTSQRSKAVVVWAVARRVGLLGAGTRRNGDPSGASRVAGQGARRRRSCKRGSDTSVNAPTRRPRVDVTTCATGLLMWFFVEDTRAGSQPGGAGAGVKGGNTLLLFSERERTAA